MPSFHHVMVPFLCTQLATTPLFCTCHSRVKLTPVVKGTATPYNADESGPLDLGLVVISRDGIAAADLISFHIFIKTSHLKDQVGPNHPPRD